MRPNPVGVVIGLPVLEAVVPLAAAAADNTVAVAAVVAADTLCGFAAEAEAVVAVWHCLLAVQH